MVDLSTVFCKRLPEGKIHIIISSLSSQDFSQKYVLDGPAKSESPVENDGKHPIILSLGFNMFQPRWCHPPPIIPFKKTVSAHWRIHRTRQHPSDASIISASWSLPSSKNMDPVQPGEVHGEIPLPSNPISKCVLQIVEKRYVKIYNIKLLILCSILWDFIDFEIPLPSIVQNL